jgi:DNA (cytosine-5)-methyltransferase 1
LENVEEFQTWGPLKKGRPIKSKKGETFNKWKKQLESLGYKIEHRELRACDYGAPTIRKRFFLIARRDGIKIKWPEPTHGDPNSLEVQAGELKPWKTAADIIDWSIPCKSIFERNKPLAENTLKRIARGLEKFVFNSPEPFIVSIGQTGFSKDRSRSIHEPLNTIVTKAEACLIAPTLIQYHTETTKNGVRGQRINEPIMTLDSSPRYGLSVAYLSKYYAGNYKGYGSGLDEPVHTLTSKEHNALVEINLDGYGDHREEVKAFLTEYYSCSIGQRVNEPLHTITSRDKLGLVMVHGKDYEITDIGLRMLEPHELFAAQGFPKEYIIDKDYTGKPYPKTAQVARCGNAVPPPFAEALVRVNLPELCLEEAM